jgi:DNA-binding protein HU-beta
MNKGYLIEAVAKRLGTTETEAKKAINAVLEEIGRSLVRREDVGLTGFGTFTVADRAERLARNPQTGERVAVPATVVVKFKAGQRLLAHVRGELTAAEDGRVTGKVSRFTQTVR